MTFSKLIQYYKAVATSILAERGRERERGGGRGERERDGQRDRETDMQTDRQTDRQNSNSKTLILKDSSVRSIWTLQPFLAILQTERERERETD